MRTHSPRFPPMPRWYREATDALKSKLAAGDITPAEYDRELENLWDDWQDRRRSEGQ